ncbi:MAG TPA: glycosyltransferase family 2 protein [Candidatus Bathyarchaeia archaeon]|nr:glycosyltransferase family 2 protein [Candidatus Bathyarchaeia archaeon]
MIILLAHNITALGAVFPRSMPTDYTSIVIPTYNERENVPELLERIHRSMASLGPFEIVIVDDDSPDETWKVASQQSNGDQVRVIRRHDQKGLATAVLTGIQAASYDVVVVMDADLQHPPEMIPQLVSHVQNGADIAIGSRFAEHGTTQGFSFSRRLLSRGADLLARTLFREIRSIKDPESGFFAFKKNVIDRANLSPVGYKILLEILVQGDYNTVSEVGYTFEKRENGASKFGVKNAADYLHHTSSLFLRSGEFHRFWKFVAVGAVGAILNLALLYALTGFGVYYLLAGAVGIEAGLLSNFFLNRSWTYRDRGTSGFRYVLTALYRDHAVRFVGIVLNLVILWLLTSVFGLYYLTSQLIGIAVAMLWNYGGNQWWTWEPTV